MARRIKLGSLLRENMSKLTLAEKRQLLEDLKGMKEVLSPLEPMYLESDEEEPETVVNNILRTGDIDDNNIVRIDGIVQKALPLDDLEKQSISNFTKARPTPSKATNPHAIRYDHMADRNNVVTVIQKMQEGSEFKFVAFQRIISSNAEGDIESPTGGKLKVITTRTFPDGQKGGGILADLLKLLKI